MISKIDTLFGSKTRVTLLSKLMMNPDKQFYLRELSRDLKIPYSMLYKEEKTLVSLGILSEEKRGNVTFVYVNKKVPYFTELKSLITKTVGLGDVVKTALLGLKGIRFALIFGSFARGEESVSSDVDLLIIGNLDEEKILKAVSQAEVEVAREINYILWSEQEFKKRIRSRNHLLVEIASNPIIIIIGEENDFRRAVNS